MNWDRSLAESAGSTVRMAEDEIETETETASEIEMRMEMAEDEDEDDGVWGISSIISPSS